MSAVEQQQQSTPALAGSARHANELGAALRAGGAGAPAGGNVHVLLVTAYTAHDEPPVEKPPTQARLRSCQVYSPSLEPYVSRLTQAQFAGLVSTP